MIKDLVRTCDMCHRKIPAGKYVQRNAERFGPDVLMVLAENEDREEFSDMERAWSLQQMKQALSDAPWEEVETRLQLSRTRRHQLIRLLAFTPAP